MVSSSSRTSQSSATSSSSENSEIDRRELQKFVLLRKGNLYARDHFYVALVKRKSRRKRILRLLDKKKDKKEKAEHKYVRVEKDQLHKARGQLLAKGYDEIVSGGGSNQFVPLEMAQDMQTETVEEAALARLEAATDRVLEPQKLNMYNKETKEYDMRYWIREGMANPSDDAPEVFVNGPESLLMNGPPKRGATVLGTYRGRCFVLTGGGAVFLYSEANREWFPGNIDELQVKITEKIRQQVERTEKEEVDEWKRRCRELEKQVKELRKEVRKETEPPPSRGEVGGLGGFDLHEPPGKRITDLSKAIGLNAVTRSIELWGRDSPYSPMDWLGSAIQVAKAAGVSVKILHEVLPTRMKPTERQAMFSLIQQGVIKDAKDFIQQFSEKYATQVSAMQKLREVHDAQMTTSQIAELKYYDFGNELQRKAHEAYQELGVDRVHWDVLDEIVVVLAFVSGILQRLPMSSSS